MSLVETFTLVRHGFSEANYVQKMTKSPKSGSGEQPHPTVHGVPPEFFDRHDSLMRLTKQGVEQARAAGEWLRANHAPFDRFYTSPHTRTLETAHHLGLNGEWRVDDRFRERDWGDLHSITPDGKPAITAEMQEAKDKSEWYWRPQNGETLASDVRLRMASVQDTLYRKESSANMLAVSHGEFLRVAQFVIEKMNPLSWEAMDRDPAYKVQNCMILQYTTRNPFNPEEVASDYRWRRAICPWDESLSWNGGEWVELDLKKYSDSELVALFSQHDTLFPFTTSLPIVES